MSGHHSLIRVVAASILISTFIAPATTAAGRTNSNVANTVLNGKGAPTAKAFKQAAKTAKKKGDK